MKNPKHVNPSVRLAKKSTALPNDSYTEINSEFHPLDMHIVDSSNQENKPTWTKSTSWVRRFNSLSYLRSHREERDRNGVLSRGSKHQTVSNKPQSSPNTLLSDHVTLKLGSDWLELRLLLDEAGQSRRFSWIFLLWLLRHDTSFKHLLCRKTSATISHSFNKVTAIKGGATCIAVRVRKTKHSKKKQWLSEYLNI